MKITELIGKELTKIDWIEDSVKFFWNGGSAVFEAIGDCCSISYIAAFDGAEDILNSPIISVVEAEMPDAISDKVFEGQQVEYLQFYGYRFHTITGSALLEFRNESNGYYGGYLKYRGQVEV
jgi:hypothetical protein